MATIKSYSDLQQSKKLAEILPLESADMYYREVSYGIYDLTVHLPNTAFFPYPKGIYAWSLSALISVLPILDNRSPVMSKTFDGEYRVVYHSTTYEKAILTSDYDNPVDACYEMIIKLNELKML